MNYNEIQSVRILPNNKQTFNLEEDFKFFIEKTMICRGGLYYFPDLMMTCPPNTLVLFQYDGMIRATAVLIEAVKKPIIDELGVQYAGYYKFDVDTIHYLDIPVNKETLRKAYPEFNSFSQSKQIIPGKYLHEIISMLQGCDSYYLHEIQEIITDIDSDIEMLELKGKEAEAFSKYRINQSQFRALLINKYHVCCLCGISNKELLVASHIKPWSKSNSEEKLDINNGFLMCTNHDRLFDAGLISFENSGNIMISSELSENDRELLKLCEDMKIALTDRNKIFLDYHRKYIFKK